MKQINQKLFKAKKEFTAISKDSTNPFYKSKYFDINALLSQVEPILHNHGLMVLQPIKDNKVYSQIVDVESGDNIDSSIELPNINDPQKLGSAITYYRRYTLQSLLSLQAEDDDANLTKTVELQELTKSGYDYLLKDGKPDEIKKAFKTRKMTTQQKETLTSKLNK